MTKYFNEAGVEFKVGDVVIVTREVNSYSESGMGPGVKWDNCWAETMNEYVGQEFTIESIRSTGVRLSGPSWQGFPITALEQKLKVIDGKIEAGDTVRVVSAEGCDDYEEYVGKDLKVIKVDDDMVQCATPSGDKMGWQFTHRYQLVSKGTASFDLKDGQRVQVKDGRVAVVFTQNDKKYIGYIDGEGRQNGFDPAHFDTTGRREYFSIVKVYEQPTGNSALKLLAKGNLLWSNNAVAIAEADAAVVIAQKTADDAEATFDKASVALHQATDALIAAKHKVTAARK